MMGIMGTILLAFIAFVFGFVLVWTWTEDLGSNVVIFTSDDELQEMCWTGLRHKKD